MEKVCFGFSFKLKIRNFKKKRLISTFFFDYPILAFFVFDFLI